MAFCAAGPRRRDRPESLRKGLSVNVASFTVVLAKLQPLAAATGTSLRIVHDEQVHFDKVFREYLAIGADPSNQEIFEEVRITTRYPVLDAIADLEFIPSHSEPLVQAADYLAGSIVYLIKRLVSGDGWTPAEAELANMVLTGFLIPQVAEMAFHYLGGDELFGTVFRAVLDHDSPEPAAEGA